jgi:hypothetical protein
MQVRAGVQVLCVPLRLYCRRYGWKVAGISSNPRVFIGEPKSSHPQAPADNIG